MIEQSQLRVQEKTDLQAAEEKNGFSDPDYRVSWPEGWEKVEEKEVAQSARDIDASTWQKYSIEEISQDALVLRKKMGGQRCPNISIVKDSPVTQADEYLDSLRSFYEKEFGWNVVKLNHDKTMGVGTLEAELSPFGVPTFTIQKFYFRKKYSVILTITQLTQDQLDEDPNYATEVTDILQSLVFLT